MWTFRSSKIFYFESDLRFSRSRVGIIFTAKFHMLSTFLSPFSAHYFINLVRYFIFVIITPTRSFFDPNIFIYILLSYSL